MLKLLLILIAVPVYVMSHEKIGGTTNVRPCPGSPEPDTVDILNCFTAPCIFRRKESIVTFIGFIPDRQINSMTAHVNYLNIATGVTKELPLDEKERDPCENMIVEQCPIQPDNKVYWHLNVTFLPEYSIGYVFDFTVQAKDENGQDVTCFKFEGITLDSN